MNWIACHPGFKPEMLGLMPSFLDDRDLRSAREQINANYAHGGGWFAIEGFHYDKLSGLLEYEGDPPYKPLAMSRLRDEVLIFYEYQLLMVLQKNGSYEVTRID